MSCEIGTPPDSADSAKKDPNWAVFEGGLTNLGSDRGRVLFPQLPEQLVAYLVQPLGHLVACDRKGSLVQLREVDPSAQMGFRRRL